MTSRVFWMASLLCLAPDVSHAVNREATYQQLDIFARVLAYVENDYVDPVDERQLVYAAIRGMLDTLDPHSVFMTPEVFQQMKAATSGEFGGLGIELAKKGDELVVVSPMDGSPAARAGIRTGDRILKIDGQATQGMDLGVAVQKMRGAVGQKVRLTLMREGFQAPLEVAIARDHIRIAPVEGQLYRGIAHVKIKNFQERADFFLRHELDRLRALNGGAELRGLVLDLRNNPGGLLDQAVAVSDRFLPGNLVIVSTRGREGKNVTVEKSRDRGTESPYPIVVLVNGGSASASEIVAGALQDHGRGIVMGTATFGKGSVQTLIELKDGSGLKLTIARYYTPKGRSIQERGISPDFWVPETEGGTVPQELSRERDLKRHLRAEGSPREAVALVPQEVSAFGKPWAVTSKLSDYQLKVALNYLNELASSKSSHEAHR